jgi:2Fe-2S ferredoxin
MSEQAASFGVTWFDLSAEDLKERIVLTKVIFEKADGDRVEVDAKPGMSIMRVAVENNVGGVVAQCGGTAACGTCHCFVLDGGGTHFDPPTPQEVDILEFVAVPAQDNSRLSCQLVVPESGGPIVVRLPERQL